MAFFDSILPQQAATAAPTLPPSLVALLKGLPTTANAASALPATPPGGNPGAPANPMLGAAPPMPTPVPAGPGPGPGPKPVLPIKQAAPGNGLPLPNAVTQGIQAGAEGAANAPTYDSPLATLASSVLEGIRKGVPAYRAQKQANAEANYAADLQQAQEKQWRDYTNNDKLFASYGPAGQTIQNFLKGTDRATGEKYLAEKGLDSILPQNTIIKTEDGGLYDTSKSGDAAWVRLPTDKRTFKPGDVANAYDPTTGKPLLNADGSQKTIMPAGPVKEKTTWENLSDEDKAYALKVGVDPSKGAVSAAQAGALLAAKEADKQRTALAGRAPAEDIFTKKALDDLSAGHGQAAIYAQSLPALYDAQHILSDPTQTINVGLGHQIKQLAAQLTGAKSAEATQQVMGDVISTILPQLDAQHVQGVTQRVTPMEIQTLAKGLGTDESQNRAVIQHFVNMRVQEAEGAIRDYNGKVGALASQKPEGAGVLGAQYIVNMPTRPAAPVVKHPKSKTGYATQTPDGKWVEAPAPGGGQ